MADGSTAASGPQCCDVCGARFVHRYRRSWWGDAYCEHHATCPSCQRPRPDGQVGRCDACRHEAVTIRDEAVRSMLRVRAWMAGLGLDVDVRDAPLRLVDVPPPARDASEVREPARTLTQELRRTDPFGRTTVTRSITGVEVVRGLTRVHYGSLVAHELTHAWVFLADVGLPSGPVEEGVAELVRWYWLRSRDEAEAAYWAEAMEQNRDPVYGEGFRWVRARYRGEPLAGFIRSLGASAGGVSPSG